MVSPLHVALENLQMIYKELAEALAGFSFYESGNGYGINRTDSPEHGFFMFLPDETTIDPKEVKETIQNESRLYIPSSIENSIKETLEAKNFKLVEQSLSIFYKEKGVHPSLMDAILEAPLSIKTFSFNQRGKVDSLYERLDLLPGLIKASQQPFFKMKQISSNDTVVERIPRGILHLFDGKFWIMEDYYENFLACAITIPFSSLTGNKGLGVFFLLTPHDLTTGDYSNALLANIELQERCDFILVYDETDSSRINQNFGYQLLERFKLFVNI